MKSTEANKIHCKLNDLLDILNHRMTQVEASFQLLKSDVKWMKRIGYYMAGIVTAIGVKLII